MNKIKIADAARELGVSRQRVYELAQLGHLKIARDRFTGTRFIRRADLDKFKARARPPGRPRKS